MRTWIIDTFHRLVIRCQLFFIRDKQKRKCYLIAYAMYSKQGREALANAMCDSNIKNSMNPDRTSCRSFYLTDPAQIKAKETLRDIKG